MQQCRGALTLKSSDKQRSNICSHISSSIAPLFQSKKPKYFQCFFSMPDSKHSPEPLEMFRGASSHMKAVENVLAAPGGLRSLQAPSFARGFHLVGRSQHS